MPLISATYGNENFQRSSAKYQIFACRTSVHNRSRDAQMHLWMAARDGAHGIVESGRAQTIPAAPGKKLTLGKWTTGRYDVPDQLVLKIFGQRKISAMTNGRYARADILLRMRPGAAMIRIRGRLSGDPRAEASDVVVFEGRADIITVPQAVAAGVVLPALFESFKPHNVQTLFVVEELEPETEQLPTIQKREIKNTKGEAVEIEEAVSDRYLDLG